MEHNDQSIEHHNSNATSMLNDTKEYLYSFPTGYKFDPSDAELICAYLIPKMNAGPLPVNLMHEVNIYQCGPEDLAEKYPPQGSKCWYYFTPRDKKYPNGKRPNRRAGEGYWKATGADKVIKQDGVEVGFRKALVYYNGRPPRGEKTLWIMHEYRVAGPSIVKKRKFTSIGEGTNMRLDDCVLCRVYKKKEDASNGSKKNKSRTPQQDVQDVSHGGEPEAEDTSQEAETSSFGSVQPSNNAEGRSNMYSINNNYVNTNANFQPASDFNNSYVNTASFQSASNYINQHSVGPYEALMDNTGFSDQCSSIGDHTIYFADGSKGSYYDVGDSYRFLLEEPTRTPTLNTMTDLMGVISYEGHQVPSFSHEDMKKITMPPPPRP